MGTRRIKNPNETAQRQQMAKAIKNLSKLITDETKPLYKSRTFWTAVAFLGATIGAAVMEGFDYRAIMAMAFSAIIVALRTATTKAIR